MTLFWCTMTSLYITAACISLYLEIDQEAVSILSVLLWLDIFTWVVKSLRVWKKVTSKWFLIWLVSKTIILLIPMVLWFMARWIDIDISSLIYIIISMMMVAETYSVVTNIWVIRTGNDIEEQDAMTMVISLLLKKLRFLLFNMAWVEDEKKRF